MRVQSRLQRRKTELSETKEKPERSNAADVAESLLLALDAGPNKPSLPVLEAMLAEALKANDVILVRAFAGTARTIQDVRCGGRAGRCAT